MTDVLVSVNHHAHSALRGTMNPVQNEALLAMVLKTLGIPPVHRTKRFATLGPSNERTMAKGFVSTLHDRYVTDSRPLSEYPQDTSNIGRGLLLVGPPGTGKSTLAAVTIREVWEAYRLKPLYARYADVIAAEVENVRLSKRAEREEPDAATTVHRNEVFLDRVRTAPVLALDDVGKERSTGSGFSEDHFDTLLRARHAAALPTIVTTNVRPDEFGERYNTSMQSFLYEAFDLVPMTGRDRRREA